MCLAVLPAAPEATKLGIPGNKFCLACMLSLRADGRLAGSGPKLPAKLVANFFCSTSHCFPCPTDTAGLPSSVVWLSHPHKEYPKFQSVGYSGCAREHVFTERLANLGAHAP
eukprot:642014-Pelagomonas_calceolata.AAC.2